MSVVEYVQGHAVRNLDRVVVFVFLFKFLRGLSDAAVKRNPYGIRRHSVPVMN